MEHMDNLSGVRGLSDKQQHHLVYLILIQA